MSRRFKLQNTTPTHVATTHMDWQRTHGRGSGWHLHGVRLADSLTVEGEKTHVSTGGHRQDLLACVLPAEIEPVLAAVEGHRDPAIRLDLANPFAWTAWGFVSGSV